MSFYYRKRRLPSGQDALVHKAECRDCNDGKGHGSADPAMQSRWQGPFDSEAKAIESAKQSGRQLIQRCAHCL